MRPRSVEPAGWLKAVIFDLDEVLLARDRAWSFAIEQAVLSVTGARIQPAGHAGGYRNRPWRHILSVLVEDQRDAARCEELCRDMYARSAMKHLLVAEGLGMALDKLRGARIDMGAVSREPHRLALSQLESTGLERFIAVLAGTPEGESWDAGARVGQCLSFLGREPAAVAYVSGDPFDLRAAARLGLACGWAAWPAAEDTGGFATVPTPAQLAALATLLAPR